MKTNKTLLLLSCLCFLALQSKSQSSQIRGKVVDNDNNQSLPFASINLQGQLRGTMTDNGGGFQLKWDSTFSADTLIVNFLGYHSRKIYVDQRQDSVVVKLKVQPVTIDEIEVYPRPPEYYLRIALDKQVKNSPDIAYNTYAYFRQDFEENDQFIDRKELYIKNYYPIDTDTLTQEALRDSSENESQSQILLYRKEALENDIHFGAKKFAKQKRKAEKKGEEIGDPAADASDFIDSLFGGPKTLIKFARGNDRGAFVDADNQEALDERREEIFEKSNIEFSDKTTNEVMVINVISKKKRKGKPKTSFVYYIDMATDGIIATEVDLSPDLPLILKPILLIAGIGIESFHFSYKKQNIQIKDKWFPNNITFQLKLNVTKKYLFKKNEHSVFKIKQILANNQIKVDQVEEIKEEYNFDPKKDYEKQVFNSENVKWNEVNRIP